MQNDGNEKKKQKDMFGFSNKLREDLVNGKGVVFV